MRRLARWTLNALTVLSLLLCVATVVLWVRSYRIADVFSRQATYGDAGAADDNPFTASPAKGTLTIMSGELGWASEEQLSATPPTNVQWHHSARPPAGVWMAVSYSTNEPIAKRRAVEFAGISYSSLLTTDGTTYRVVRLHFAHLLCAPLIAPAIWLYGWRRRRLRRAAALAGACAHCAYDLSGNVSGVCPECGSVIADGHDCRVGGS